MESENSLSGHELLGILSTRLVHSLSNYASALSGNVIICEAPNATAEQKQAALASIREAARRSGDLLDRFSDLARSINADATPCPLPSLLTHLHQWTSRRQGWTIQAAPQLSTQPLLALPGPWPWLQFALGAIANQILPPALLRVDPAQPPFDRRPLSQGVPSSYISLVIVAKSTPPIDWHDQRQNLSDWNLTAAYELLNQLGSRPINVETPCDDRQTSILLPLIAI